MYQHSHTIVRLSVHLEGEDRVYFHEGADLLQVAQPQSTLSAYFQSNAEMKVIADRKLEGITSRRMKAKVYREHGLHLTYPQYCKMFSWKTDAPRRWQKREKAHRKGFVAIGRMYTVNPRNVELHSLRVLLLHVPGCTSYQDLRTVNGRVFETFAEAAIVRGLRRSDEEFSNTIEEAISLDIPPAECRSLFAMLLYYNQPDTAGGVWIRFKENLIRDLLEGQRRREEEAEYLALAHMDSIIVGNGGSGIQYYSGMPEVPMNYRYFYSDHHEDACHQDIERCRRLLTERCNMLNSAQRSAFDTIVTSLQERRDEVNFEEARCFFVDGPGGTGKTFLYETLYYYCVVEGFKCIVTAWTGIAASLLPTGRTVHSTFKLPLNLTETATCNVRVNSPDGQKLEEADIILWDECSMAESRALTAVNEFLQELEHTTVPFGGKVMVMGGDFRQILPVVQYGDRSHILEKCVLENACWPLFRSLKLHHNQRAAIGQEAFATHLNDVGEGRTNNELGLHVFDSNNCVITINNLIQKVFGKSRILPDDCAILCPRRDACQQVNHRINDRLPGEGRSYRASNRIVDEDDKARMRYNDEFLDAQNPAGLAPQVLLLKKGSIIMLIRNLDSKMGLCNGTRLRVLQTHNHLIKCVVLNGIRKGVTIHLPRIDITTTENDDVPVNFTRRQFPVIGAFAMTINKSQGQTLRRVGLYLPSPVFAHGHLYVAMSRVRHMEDIQVVISHGRLGIADNDRQTKNIVYEEIIQRLG
ncbi:uncharacterized protein LOC129808488 [Phlebotomus papatasi]|uniref:uncharacterized protein LOC129808487 n=1 Tax=Phlebotomus papatasi TaxID=29031 RepID=UPI002484672F|nr:uncharacterized protein LOC129808487 [Phlebotomus papatasi]XP_055714241.1 uncharacterized protein LOC129808488 [Phlebotomus papatasi]